MFTRRLTSLVLPMLLFLFVPFALTTFSYTAAAADRTLTEADVAARMLSHEPSNWLILDVRTPQEYADGHVPGAINIPYDKVEAQLERLGTDHNRELLVYCRSGHRAKIAAETLHQHGFSNISFLEGNMPLWIKNGLPVAR